MANTEHIERILGDELETRKKLYEAAAASFRRVTHDVPSGIPYPDSVMRIREAADNHNRALDAYSTALRRFNDYAIRRIVPDDLMPPPEKSN